MNGSPVPCQCHARCFSHLDEHQKVTLGRHSSWQSLCINSPSIFLSVTSREGDAALPLMLSICGETLTGHYAYARARVGVQQTHMTKPHPLC